MSESLSCPQCGQRHAPEDAFCQHCGQPLATPAEPAGPAAEPAAAFGPTAASRPAPGRVKRSAALIVGGLALGLVLLLAGAAALILVFFNLSGSRDQILLGMPHRSGNMDLLLLRLGQDLKQAREIIRGAQPADRLYLTARRDGRYHSLRGAYNLGAFVPGTDHLLFWSQEDNDITLQELALTGRTPVRLLDANAGGGWGVMLDQPALLLFSENTTQGVRCLLSRAGQEAERLGRGASCTLSYDGSLVLIGAHTRDGLDLTAIRTANGDEVTLLEEAQGASEFRVSADGTQVAYLDTAGGGQTRVVVIDSRDGEVLAKSDRWPAIRQFEYAPRGSRLLYVARDEDGDQVLFTSDDHAEPVAQGPALQAGFSPDGDALIYVVTDRDGEATLSVLQAGAEEAVDVVRGAGLGYAVSPALDRLLITETDGDDFTLYSAGLDGLKLVELYHDRNVVRHSVFHADGADHLYVVTDDDEGRATLVATPTDHDDPLVLVEEWADIQLLAHASNGRQLAFAGREDPGDDLVLYTLNVADGAEPVELDDDADRFVNAAFTSDDARLVYTAVTGDSADDVEVRVAHADGRDPFETLYEEAVLVDVRWTRLQPFDTLFWR